MNEFIFRLLTACLIVPIPGLVVAQSDDARQSVAIEEVIVTATRREESVMEVSQSMQAVMEAKLELPTFNDLSDIHNLVPGATGFSNKAPATEGIQFRASGITQSAAADGQAPVGYYVDDVPYIDISTPVPPPIGTFDLQRIEMLRGPQGTSYGQDSLAGSVILRTNPVDLEKFGYKIRTRASVTESSDGAGYGIGGVVNLPIVKDVFGLRLSYLREEDPGYGRVADRPDIDKPLKSTRDTIRAKAFWQVTDRLDLELTHTEWNTDYGVLPGTQILDSSDGTMVLSPVETDMLLTLFPDGRLENDYDISWTTFLTRLDVGFAELTYTLGYVDSPKKETNYEYIFDIGLGPQKTAIVFNQPAESTSQEVRLVSTTGGKLQWIGGLFYLDAESNSAGFTETPDFGVYSYNSDPRDSEVWAVYGNVDYAFSDRWSVQAGLRYQEEDRKDTYDAALGFIGVDPLFGPYSLPSPTEVYEDSFDNLSYRAGLTWNPSPNGMVYLTHSLANRAPNILPPADARAIEQAGFDPGSATAAAELLNTELGAKWSLADGRMQLSAAYVYGDWSNIPIFADLNIPGSMPIAMPLGGTDAVVETLEFEISWAITDHVRLDYAFVHTDTEVKKTPPEGSVSGYPPVIQEGGELFNYSPQTHNIGVSFDYPLASGWDLFSSLNYVTRDKPDGFNLLSDPTAYVPAADRYENLGFNLGVATGPWSFTFSVENATDHDGQYLPLTESGGTVAMLFGLIQQPRTYALQLTYDGMR